MVRRFLKLLAILFVLVGICVSAYFLLKLSLFYKVNGNDPVLLTETGQVGDFIGGVVGTIFSLAGFFILILTLSEQTKFTTKERFESKFFDLLKLHRENVNELKTERTSGRKEFEKILLQFLTCREDLKPCFRKLKESKIYEIEYLNQLKSDLKYTNPNIDLVDLAKLNFPYLVTFFGVTSVGRQAIFDILDGKYRKEFIEKVLDFISLKPEENSPHYKNWGEIMKMQFKFRIRLSSIIRKMWNNEPIEESSLKAKAKFIYYNSEFNKYYKGHQHQLGHYFRHMYQSFNFIENQRDINEDEKYFYAKILRAQLSTSEQLLLFVNSISTLGLVWDLTPEYESKYFECSKKREIDQRRKITNFNLIKNIPGKEIYGIKFKNYYPDVQYEHMKFKK